MKHGTEEDRRNVTPEHRNNRSHDPGRKRRVHPLRELGVLDAQQLFGDDMQNHKQLQSHVSGGVC